MDSDKPKISLIIPVYNSQEYLPKLFDSIYSQTFKNLEIICVDDCSTDNSYRMLEEYAGKDSRIRLYRNRVNHGLAVTRSRALNKAKGNYIMFVDPDDWLEPDACKLCYKQIKKNKNDIVIFPNYIYDEATDTYKTDFSLTKSFASVADKPNITLSDADNIVLKMQVWNKIYRRNFLKKYKIKFLRVWSFDDQSFTTEVLLRAKNMSVINKPLYYYRIRGNSIIQKSQYSFLDMYKEKREILKILKKLNPEDKIKKSFINHYIVSLCYFFNKFKNDGLIPEMGWYCVARKLLLLLDNSFVEKNVRGLLSSQMAEIYDILVQYSYLAYKFNLRNNNSASDIL